MTYAPAEHPESILPVVEIERLSREPGLAIVAVAGRDSVAAALVAARERGFSVLLPTSVATGTEFGDEFAPVRAAAVLRELAGPDLEVLPVVRFGSPRLWAALNGGFATRVAERFGLCSPCLACHLYVHLARVPLAWALGEPPIVTGERDSHDGRLKLSQTPASIEAERLVLDEAGVELITPIRGFSGSDVADVLAGRWQAAGHELECVHSGNYAREDGSVRLDADAYARYLAEFFIPAGLSVVGAWRAHAEPDYAGLVSALFRAREERG